MSVSKLGEGTPPKGTHPINPSPSAGPTDKSADNRIKAKSDEIFAAINNHSTQKNRFQDTIRFLIQYFSDSPKIVACLKKIAKEDYPREAILDAINNNTLPELVSDENIEKISTYFQNDKEVFLAIVKKNVNAVKYAKPHQIYDTETAFAAINQDPSLIKFFLYPILSFDLFKAAVKQDPSLFKYYPSVYLPFVNTARKEELKELAKEAIKADGMLFEVIAKNIPKLEKFHKFNKQDVLELFDIATTQNWRAAQYGGPFNEFESALHSFMPLLSPLHKKLKALYHDHLKEDFVNNPISVRSMHGEEVNKVVEKSLEKFPLSLGRYTLADMQYLTGNVHDNLYKIVLKHAPDITKIQFQDPKLEADFLAFVEKQKK